MDGVIDRRARICVVVWEDAATGTEYICMYVCMYVGDMCCMVRRDSYSEAYVRRRLAAYLDLMYFLGQWDCEVRCDVGSYMLSTASVGIHTYIALSNT